MKKKKTVVFVGLLAAVCMVSTGCGKMTAEKLVVKMAEAENEKQVTGMDVEADMKISYNMDVMGADISMDADTQVDMKLKLCPDPIGVYMEMDMDMEVMEEALAEHIQAYLTEEDGALVSYTYSTVNNLWSRTAMEEDYGSWEESLEEMAFVGAGKLKDVELEEELTEVDGREAYVLHGSNVLDDESFSTGLTYGMELMIPDAEEALSDISTEGMAVPMTLYVDKETYFPLKVEMDFSCLDEFLNKLFSVMIEEVLQEAEEGSGMGFNSFEISLSKCDISMSGFTFEPQEIPKVPEEAFRAIAFQEALEELDPDLGDGSYAIRNGAGAVKVVGPEDMELADLTVDTASFMNMSTMSTLVYNMAAAGNETLYMESIESMYKGILEAAGYEVQTGKEEGGVTSAFGDLDGYWVSGGGMGIYYTFADVNGTCLMVMCTDMADGEPDAVAVLNAVMANVSELTPEDILN